MNRKKLVKIAQQSVWDIDATGLESIVTPNVKTIKGHI